MQKTAPRTTTGSSGNKFIQLVASKSGKFAKIPHETTNYPHLIKEHNNRFLVHFSRIAHWKKPPLVHYCCRWHFRDFFTQKIPFFTQIRK